MQRFYIANVDGLLLRLYLDKKEMKMEWTSDREFASHYTSKYAAKSHLKVLRANFNLPETVTIV